MRVSDRALSGPAHADFRGPQQEPLPAFLAKAKEDAETRRALAHMGYRRVSTAYTRQTKGSAGTEAFLGLGHKRLWPSLEFVGDWLKEERKRIRAQVRATFFVAMLSGLGAGAAFALGLMVLP